jgi:hypothetical protein
VARDAWAVLIDPETVPSIDPGAARMLRALADNLEREGVILVLARDVGQVQDVLERADSEGPDGSRGRRRPAGGRCG